MVAGLTLKVSQIGVAWANVAPLVGLAALLVATQVFYSRQRLDKHIAATCGMLAVIISASLLAAVISHTSLRIGMPFVDHALSEADKAIGWHSPDMVQSFAGYPWFSNALATLYNTALPVSIVCALALAVSQRTAHATEFVWSYVFCILLASVSAIFLPALGSTVYHGIEEIAGLPQNAGNFHMPVVDYYRSTPDAVFNLNMITGIVTFPSFHMVMALLVPYAVRGETILFWIAVLWAGLVSLSAVVIGGHYLIDLIVGAFCWMVAVKTAAGAHASIRA